MEREIIEAKVKLKIMKDLFEASEKIIAEKEAELREESIRLEKLHYQVWKAQDEVCIRAWDFSEKHDFTKIMNNYPKFPKNIDTGCSCKVSTGIEEKASNNIGDQETTLHQVILEKNSQEKDLNKLINNNLTKTGNISEKLQENETAETDQSETDSVSKTKFNRCPSDKPVQLHPEVNNKKITNIVTPTLRKLANTSKNSFEMKVQSENLINDNFDAESLHFIKASDITQTEGLILNSSSYSKFSQLKRAVLVNSNPVHPINRKGAFTFKTRSAISRKFQS